jgi:hypothetical protein
MQHMHGNQGVLVPQDARIATGVASEDRQPADEDDSSKDSTDEASDHTADSRGSEEDDQVEETVTETDTGPRQTRQAAMGLPPVSQLVTPFFDDVIGGRGRGQNEHDGNQGYRRAIKANCQHYHQLVSNADKTDFTRRIVSQVRETRRFLKQVGKGEYIEMTEEEARQKVGQVRR